MNTILTCAELERLLTTYKHWIQPGGDCVSYADSPPADLTVLGRPLLQEAIRASEMVLLAFLVGTEARWHKSRSRCITPTAIFCRDPRDPRLLRGLSLLLCEGLVTITGSWEEGLSDETEIELTTRGVRLMDERMAALIDAGML